MVNKWGKKRSVMRRYNLTAQMYDARYCEEQEAKYQAALKSLDLNRGSVVLDAGCGSGMFFNQIASTVQTVVGADISKELLLLAKQRASKFSNVFLVLADADNLPLKGALFDDVFAFTILQNMPNPAKTLMEMQSCAKPNANFVLTGLKAAISLEKLGATAERAGLRVIALLEAEKLQCHVIKAVKG